MFLVHYAVLAACFALSQVSDYAGSPNQQIPLNPPAAQQAAPQSAKPGKPASSTVLVPQQIHKVDPPSPSATAQELEDSGDDLRIEKAFADALDYYRAAMAKADSAVLHNKVGITYLQMLRKNDAKREFERSIK